MDKKMLLPSEIEDITRAVEHLSGYGTATLEEIKKIDTDPSVQLMYYMFLKHSVLPGHFYNLSEGEKTIFCPFFSRK